MGLLDGFARLIPGAAAMPEDERRALAMQGLLSMGAGILANNSGNYGKAGPAIGAGISQGLLAMNNGASELADRKYRAQVMAQQAAGPAEFVAMDRMARAAGYEPGTDGYKDFFRRRNGEISKASNAGFQTIKFRGPDQRDRVGVFNPRTGTIVTPDGLSFDPGSVVPLSVDSPADAAPQPQAPAASGPSPRADFLGLADQYGAQITSLYRSPQHNKEVGGVPNSQHMAGTAGDFVVPPQAKPQFIADAKGRGYQAIDEGDHVHLELPPRPLSSRKPGAMTGAFVGPTPGEVAYGEEAARQQARTQALPTQLAMETQAAVARAAGTTAASEQAKTTAEAKKNLPKTIQQAEIMLDTINKLENHPGLDTMLGLSGKLDPRNYIPGTEVQGARALADQIQGQTFLQAYQALKGGGQITEIEGNKGEAALGRLSRAQNERDYKSALDDIKEVVNSGLRRAKEQAGYSSAPSSDPLGIL